MDATNKETITHYFDLLEENLKKIPNPAQIYNMDESGMPLDPRPPNVIAKRGQMKVLYRVSGKKEQITVIWAIGQSVPPKGKYLNHLWTAGKVSGTYYGMSGKGWTDQELFHHRLMDHFTKYAVRGQPILLLLDGHSFHYEPGSIEMAQKDDTSHNSRLSAFRLYCFWTAEMPLVRCLSQIPTEESWHGAQQVRVFSTAWLRAHTPANIVAGFKKVVSIRLTEMPFLL